MWQINHIAQKNIKRKAGGSYAFLFTGNWIQPCQK